MPPPVTPTPASPGATGPRKRGAKPTPPDRLRRAPMYRPAAIDAAPYLILPERLSYWDNNVDGCCVTSEEAFAAACAGVLISDAEVIRWARARGWLNGAFLDEVLDAMKEQGFQQDSNSYNVGNKLRVDYTDWLTLTDAIRHGPVKIAVAADQLDGTVGTHNGWFGRNFHQDGNVDHCVSLPGHGTAEWLAKCLQVSVPSGHDPATPSVAMFTWDTVGIVDFRSMLNITNEAWIRNPLSVRVGNGTPTADKVVVFGDSPTPTPTPTPSGDDIYDIVLSTMVLGHKLDITGTATRRPKAMRAALAARLAADLPAGLTPDQIRMILDAVMAVLHAFGIL